LDTLRGVDIAVLDSYLAKIDIYRKISEMVKIPIYLDDFKRLDYTRSMVVNGAIYAEELKYPEREGVAYLLGADYTPLREEFWNVPKKEIRTDLKSLLVTFGGDDNHRYLGKLTILFHCYKV